MSWTKFKEEALSFNPALRLFLLAAMVIGFCIACEYGATRPASNAFFVANFGAGAFPYAWLATVPLNFLVVYLYNRFLPKLGCLRMLATIVFCIVSINVMTGLFVDKYPALSFFHYIWKDIYILLMFKQLWSLIHSTIDTGKAKYLYGILFGIGGLGSIMGSLIPGFFAVHVGSNSLFFFTLPIYLVLFIAYSIALKQSKEKIGFQENFSKAPKEKGGFRLIFQKKYLTMILLLVVFMQVSIALADYQFNYYLERNVLDLDLKTQYCGRVISIVNTLTTTFQFLGGFVLIHFLGLATAHRLVPLLLSANGLLFLFFPTFGFATYSLIAIKSIDHSFFGIIREMLYIPLSSDDKFRAKAVIDVFAYRTAKALASLLILSFQFIWVTPPAIIISLFALLILFLWSLLVIMMFRKKILHAV